MAKTHPTSDVTPLSPCPFCGGTASIYACKFNEGRYRNYYPSCDTDGCPAQQVEDGEFGGTPVDCSSIVEAAILWNRRAI